MLFCRFIELFNVAGYVGNKGADRLEYAQRKQIAVRNACAAVALYILYIRRWGAEAEICFAQGGVLLIAVGSCNFFQIHVSRLNLPVKRGAFAGNAYLHNGV